jgi:hypothetical protein
MRYTSSRAPNSLCVIVPRRFSLILLLFIPLWIAGWVTIALTNPSGKPQSILGLLTFGLFTVFMVYRWLWNLSGKEELMFTTSELTYRRILFGISRARVFMMDGITDPHFVAPRTRGMTYTPSGLGFCYAGKQIRVCDQLTQQEANEVVKAVVRQVPELSERWGRYVEGMFGYEISE